jgi:hypothetical protein
MDKWISVETPPEKKGYYLAWDINFGSEQPMDVLFYQPYNQSWYYKADTFHPTHWMPLPNKPGDETHCKRVEELEKEVEDELWVKLVEVISESLSEELLSIHDIAEAKKQFSITRK